MSGRIRRAFSCACGARKRSRIAGFRLADRRSSAGSRPSFDVIESFGSSTFSADTIIGIVLIADMVLCNLMVPAVPAPGLPPCHRHNIANRAFQRGSWRAVLHGLARCRNQASRGMGRLTLSSAESSSSSYGLLLRFRPLSTAPRGDAVTAGSLAYLYMCLHVP